MSRPTLLTKELEKEICGYIENGNSLTTAHQLAGISASIFYEWKAKGEEALKNGVFSKFLEFSENIKKARAKNKAWHIQNINTAAKKQWKASAWYLERVYPEEYGRKESFDVKAEHTYNVVPAPESKEDQENGKKDG